MMHPRLALITAGLLLAGAIGANLAFAGLASAFDYPDILARPATEVLGRFAADSGSILPWFLVLIAAAGLLAPIAILVGRLSDRSAMRRAVRIGVAAAAVQVLGLLRWPLLVPQLAERAADTADPTSRPAAIADFELASGWLGTILGETVGYALTAGWTLLVLVALGRAFGGRWFIALGAMAAGLIALGVLAPLGVPGVDEANFIGYVLWSVWLVALAAVLVRRVRAPVGARRAAAGGADAERVLTT